MKKDASAMVFVSSILIKGKDASSKIFQYFF